MDSKIRIEVKKISDEIVEGFRKELIQQGYFASGSLDKSFKVRIQHKPSLINVDVFSNDYAKILNYGAKPFYPDIKELERWVEDKGFANTPAEKKEIRKIIKKFFIFFCFFLFF